MPQHMALDKSLLTKGQMDVKDQLGMHHELCIRLKEITHNSRRKVFHVSSASNTFIHIFLGTHSSKLLITCHC